MVLLPFCETIHTYSMCMKQTADELNETQIHFLPAGGDLSVSLVAASVANLATLSLDLAIFQTPLVTFF